jgi:hypothetical protein
MYCYKMVAMMMVGLYVMTAMAMANVAGWERE